MSTLILPQKWTSQPQTPVEIDWSNPLAQRCVGAYLPANNNLKAGGPSLIISNFGVGYKFLRTSSQHITIPLTSPISLTSSGATLIGIFNSTDIDAGQCAFALTDGGSHFSVLPRGDLFGDPISVASWNASSSSFRQFRGPSYASGVNYVVAITTDTAGNFDIYLDGVLQSGSYTNAGTIPSVSMTKLEIGASNGTGDFLSGSVFSALAFKGRLNQQEIKALSDNPWQIFKAPQRRIWVASAGTTPTIAAGNSVVSTGTSTQGSVSQEHNLSGDSCGQNTTSTQVAIVQTNVVTGSSARQDNTSASGAVTQLHTVAGNSVAQGATSSVGAVSQNHVLSGASAAQPNTSTAGDVTAPSGAIVLTGNSSRTDHTSSTGACIQEQLLAGNSARADSSCTAGGVGQDHVLAGTGALAQTTSAAGAVLQAHILVGNGVAIDHIAEASAIVQTHILSGMNCVSFTFSADTATPIGRVRNPAVEFRQSVFTLQLKTDCLSIIMGK